MVRNAGPHSWGLITVVSGAALLLSAAIPASATKPEPEPAAPAAAGARKTGKTRTMTSTTQKLKPLLRDFMGLNGHTVMFKPELYRPVCRLVRDYHNLDWDIGQDTSNATRFPMSRNNINWEDLYGSWRKSGFDIDVCVQFGNDTASKWKDIPRDAFAYGFSFARFFGPSGGQKLADSIEIGNEPGGYPAATYRAVFENMAKGCRQGDPKLRIVTCNMVPGKADHYSQSLSNVKGLESLYDVINVHTYAFAEQYPTWRRSYPEDPKIRYLKDVTDTINWRDANAPGKEIWITEFGYDASTKPPPPTGDFSKWMSSTETQQAQYLVRSFLVFSEMDVDRAYIYFFDDNDEPQLHGSSGLTRKFVPKPSYYAVSHLYHTLGDYRFARAVAKEEGKSYVYEYRNGANDHERIWAVWLPTGSNRQEEITLPAPGGTVYKAEQMPLKSGAAESVRWQAGADGKIRVMASESPIYLWLRDN
jgi:hypothetical protein